MIALPVNPAVPAGPESQLLLLQRMSNHAVARPLPIDNLSALTHTMLRMSDSLRAVLRHDLRHVEVLGINEVDAVPAGPPLVGILVADVHVGVLQNLGVVRVGHAVLLAPLPHEEL